MSVYTRTTRFASIPVRDRAGRAAPLLTALLALTAALAFAPSATAYVYWTDSDTGAIERANTNGTSVDQSFITSANAAAGLAVDAQHVYWANTVGGTIGRANLNGTGKDRSFITGANPSGEVAVDAAHVYWTSPNGVGRANLDGTGMDRGFIRTPDPGGVAVDAGHVYWTNDEGHGWIGRANLDGTVVEQKFITRTTDAAELAVDAAHIYWTSPHGVGTIGRANLDGTGQDRSFIRTANPGGLAVDARYMYWTGSSQRCCGTIARAQLDGTGVSPGSRPLIPVPNATIRGVAVDALEPPGTVRGCLVDPAQFGCSTAIPTQEQPGKTITVKVKVTASEDLTAKARGKIEADDEPYALKPTTLEVAAGESETLDLVPRNKDQAKKIVMALRQGDKATARLTVKLMGRSGNTATERQTIRLVKNR